MVRAAGGLQEGCRRAAGGLQEGCRVVAGWLQGGCCRSRGAGPKPLSPLDCGVHGVQRGLVTGQRCSGVQRAECAEGGVRAQAGEASRCSRESCV